jgi:hypothetical protein
MMQIYPSPELKKHERLPLTVTDSARTENHARSRVACACGRPHLGTGRHADSAQRAADMEQLAANVALGGWTTMESALPSCTRSSPQQVLPRTRGNQGAYFR